VSFFDDSHVTDVGLEGSAGPTVGVWDMLTQQTEQQFRVDSQQALQQEIDNRWRDNLRMLEDRHGQRFDAPDLIRSYTSYHDNLNGAAEESSSMFFRSLEDMNPDQEWKRIEAADAAIQTLADPEIKSFQDVVQEVYAMQRALEEETSSMASRAGTAATVGGFVGAMAGSFTGRDPLNLGTLPFGGGGRTIAMRVATEMGVAGAVTAATEAAFVQPNRERAGLPERSLAFDVAAAMVGAGVLRGGFEGIGAGVRRLREGQVTIDTDFADDQLRQMFENNVNSPRARAGAAILDDTLAFEKANPYGAGPTAEARFQAELQQTFDALNGAPSTAVARVLPPLPTEMVERAADFQIVKEQSPEVWTKLETAQASVRELEDTINTAIDTLQNPSIVEAVRLVDQDAAAQLEVLSARVNDETLPEPERVAADLEAQAIIQRVNPERVEKAYSGFEQRTRQTVRRARAQRANANRQYQAAYKAVEAEATKLNHAKAVITGQQQREAVDLLGYPTTRKPFVGPVMRHDIVEARTEQINLANERVAEQSDRIAKAEIDEETGLVDIGLKTPISKDFRIPFDDGDMTVDQILIDFADDDLLDEAMRTCLI
jgi:hypothetical protein